MMSSYIKKTNMKHVYQNKVNGRLEFRGAVFLDRDGVIIEDVHYISSASDVKLVKGAKEILERFTAQGIRIVITTNQSGISRKYFKWEQYEQVTCKMAEYLGEKVQITAIYANGYDDISESNNWRKPRPGMIIDAASNLEIDLKRSIFIGDRLSDMEAATRANIKHVFFLPGANSCKMKESILQKVDSSHCFSVDNMKSHIVLLNRLQDIDESKVIEIIK